MDSFVNRLRMNNIFPTDGFNPLGPPDMNSGTMGLDQIDAIMRHVYPMIQASKDADLGRQKELLKMQQAPQLANIAKMAAQPPPTDKPLNYVYKPGINEFQRETLGLKRDELNQKGDIANRNLDVRSQNADVNQRRAELAEKIASGKATDAEKQEYDLAKINARGTVQSDIVDQRGKIGDRQIGLRGDINKDIQKTKGNQALEQIGARVAGSKEVADINVAGRQNLQDTRSVQPNQVRIQQNTAARELMNTKPELAQFIKQDETGNFTVTPPSDSFFGHSGPTKEQYDEIQKAIYGSPVTKETTKKTDKTVKPEVKTPTSKYKVTIK